MYEPYNETRYKKWVANAHRFYSRSDGYNYLYSTKKNRSHINSLTGEKNPNWRKQVAFGLNASTDLSAVSEKVVKQPFHISEDWTYTGQAPIPPVHTSGNVVTGETFPTLSDYDIGDVLSLDSSLANNLAKAQMVAELRQQETALQGGIILGEGRETLGLIRSTVKALSGGWRSYLASLTKVKKHRQFGSLSTIQRKDYLSQEVSKRWLESQFGWAPLVNDLDEGVKALAEWKLRSNNRHGKMVYAYGKDERTLKDSSRDLSVIGYPLLRCREVTKSRVTVKFYGRYAMKDFSVMSYLGLDFENFAPTLWELLPWSFLIDYFTNVGDIVSAATYNTSNLQWCSQTTVKEIERSFVGPVPFKSPVSPSVQLRVDLGSYSLGNGGVSIRSVSRLRDYVLGFVPDLVFSYPGSVSKWLNLGAIAHLASNADRHFKRLVS